MLVRCRQLVGNKPRVLRAAFTLVEMLISILLLALVMAGIVNGYAQANRMAEWSSMSLAAQSYALQGLEQVRSAKWDIGGYNTLTDFFPAPPNGTITNFPPQQDIMDVPVTGAPYYVTNYISLRQVSTAPQLREVTSKCVWTP
jgi:prepilin-type N-terminal cleavage/methylation domain-containing protein